MTLTYNNWDIPVFSKRYIELASDNHGSEFLDVYAKTQLSSHIYQWSVSRTVFELLANWSYYFNYFVICTHKFERSWGIIIDRNLYFIRKKTFGCLLNVDHFDRPQIVKPHYSEVIMSAMAYQITSFTIVYSIVYSGADQRKHQSSASLAFVRGIHRSPANSPHKGPVRRKMIPFDDVVMRPFLRQIIQTNPNFKSALSRHREYREAPFPRLI